MPTPDTAESVRLSDLLYHALVEMRHLCRQGRAEQAADLADAVHNLPTVMWRDDFDRERLREELDAYRQKYGNTGTPPLFDYSALLGTRSGE